jgi:hypothetical protein
MSDEQTSRQAPSALDDLLEDWGFSPFSDTEVKCDVCGMNIVRERDDMAKHHEFHAAAPPSDPDASPRAPVP